MHVHELALRGNRAREHTVVDRVVRDTHVPAERARATRAGMRRGRPGPIRARRRRGCRASRSRPTTQSRRGGRRGHAAREPGAAVVTSSAAASCRSFMMFPPGCAFSVHPDDRPSCEAFAKRVQSAQHVGMDLSGLEAEATAGSTCRPPRRQPCAAHDDHGRRTSRPGAACGCGPTWCATSPLSRPQPRSWVSSRRRCWSPTAMHHLVSPTPNGPARARRGRHCDGRLDGIVDPARGDCAPRRRAALRPDVRIARSARTRDGRQRATPARRSSSGRRRGRPTRRARRAPANVGASSTTSTRR